MSLKIENLTYDGDICFLNFRRAFYRDILNSFSYEFEAGKLYHIDSDFGEGGGALSHFLYGNDCIRSSSSKEYSLFYNNQKVNIDYLQKFVCLVGIKTREEEYAFQKKYKEIKKLSINRLITDGLAVSEVNRSFEDIIDIFELAVYLGEKGDKYSWTFQMSYLKWIASMAIGYARGCKIFCFPQFPRSVIKKAMGWKVPDIIKMMKSEECIIIVPTKYPETIEGMIDETIVLPEDD